MVHSGTSARSNIRNSSFSISWNALTDLLRKPFLSKLGSEFISNVWLLRLHAHLQPHPRVNSGELPCHAVKRANGCSSTSRKDISISLCIIYQTRSFQESSSLLKSEEAKETFLLIFFCVLDTDEGKSICWPHLQTDVLSLPSTLYSADALETWEFTGFQL